MSENIQSISQGNYILQGTVATSAGIVGDGSTQNPLRADETVLFSQPRNSTTTVTAFSLTEKPSNFDRIRFNGYVNGGRFSVEIPVDNTSDATMRFGSCSYSPDNYGHPLQLYGISYSSNNGLTWTKVRETLRWFNQATVTTVTGTTNATNPVIYDIVGINRINNA